MKRISGYFATFAKRLVAIGNRWRSALADRCQSVVSLKTGMDRNHSIGTIIETVSKNKNDLSNTTTEFERRFMAILQSLENLEEISSKLIKQSETLLSLTESEENPALSVNRCLKPSLEFIDGSSERLESMVSELANDKQKIGQTLSFRNKLDQTFSELNYLRTLFRVESAPLDPNSQTMFNALIEEIYSLQQDVAKIFTEKFEQLAGHQKTVTQLIEKLDIQSADLMAKAREKRRKLKDALDSQKRNLKQSLNSNAQLNAQFRKIGDAIGQAIVALQSQDIINQKLEHIFEISQDVKDRCSLLPEASSKAKRCEELRFIEYASIIIINQIRAIKKELAGAERSIGENLSYITTAILSISNASQSTSDQPADRDKRHELAKALDDAVSIASQTERIVENGFSEIQPVRGMASDVTSIIFGLSSQLHLIGLNAEMHAGQMNGCYGLKTLSANTSRVSIETKSLCRNVSSELDVLVKSLNHNVNEFETLLQEAKKDRARLDVECPSQKENLKIFESQYQAAEQAIKDHIEELNTSINLTQSDLDLKRLMIEDLERLDNNLVLLSNEAKRQADLINTQVNIPEVMDSLLDRYTMQSEKAIHLRSLGIESFQSESESELSGITEFSPPTDTLENSRIDGDWEDKTEDSSKARTAELGNNVDLF